MLCKLSDSNRSTYTMVRVATKQLPASFSAQINDIFAILYLGSRWTAGSGYRQVAGLISQTTTVGSTSTKSDLILAVATSTTVSFTNAGGTIYKYMGCQGRFIKQ